MNLDFGKSAKKTLKNQTFYEKCKKKYIDLVAFIIGDS